MDFSNDSKLTKNRNDVEYLDLFSHFLLLADISLFGFTKIMLAQSDTPTRSVNLSFSLFFLSPPLYFFFIRNDILYSNKRQVSLYFIQIFIHKAIISYSFYSWKKQIKSSFRIYSDYRGIL